MVSDRDKKIFSQLVQDCLLYGLNELESLGYIEKRSGGSKISRSSFYAIKKRISHQDSNLLQRRLSEHIRVGFALNHFKHIASLENVQKILFRTITDEYSKPINERNVFGISRLAGNMLQNIQLLRHLNIDVPFVNRMKAELDSAKESKRIADQKMGLNYSGWPPAALVPSGTDAKDSDSLSNYDDDPVVE